MTQSKNRPNASPEPCLLQSEYSSGHVGLKQIAEACNLSVMSVSRALNGAKGVGPTTRSRVVAVARELGYIPNRAASILGSRKTTTRTVGIILPVFGHTIFPEIIEGIESRLSDFGYQIFLCKTNDDPDKEYREAVAMLERRVDGIIMAPASTRSSRKSINLILQQGCPLVFIDRCLDHIDVDAVIYDDCQGAHDAVAHMIQTGCKRIVCLSGNEEIWTIQERVRGYRQAMQAAGLKVGKNDIVQTDLTFRGGEQAMDKVLSGRIAYDGVFSVAARVAIGAIKTLNRREIRMPEDIAFAGFADTIEAEMLKVPLTTVGQDAQALGCASANILIERILDSGSAATVRAARRIVIPAPLIVRESTRPMPSR
jgi:LacI family transcriptional regulator